MSNKLTGEFQVIHGRLFYVITGKGKYIRFPILVIR
jgi:hypothetical protein